MRKEATIEQWKELYEVATRIKDMKPWNKFWDLDIIGIREGNEEDTTFYSILGHGGDCYGIVVYEGYDGLNDFMMLTMQEHLTEEEHAVYKRGRNAKSVSPAKNQSITDYRRATGFEALLGYLYLKKEWKRMLELVKIGLDSIKEQ